MTIIFFLGDPGSVSCSLNSQETMSVLEVIVTLKSSPSITFFFVSPSPLVFVARVTPFFIPAFLGSSFGFLDSFLSLSSLISFFSIGLGGTLEAFFPFGFDWDLLACFLFPFVFFVSSVLGGVTTFSFSLDGLGDGVPPSTPAPRP